MQENTLYWWRATSCCQHPSTVISYLNSACYQWGVVGELATNSGNDVFSAQICQSPYQKVYENKAGKAAEMYAYNVLWNGRHGIWETFWSVNMSEYAPHKFINYISLGNKFHFTNNLQLELDYWNRAASGQGFIGKDCSVIGQLSYQPTEKLNVFAKASYEVNPTLPCMMEQNSLV